MLETWAEGGSFSGHRLGIRMDPRSPRQRGPGLGREAGGSGAVASPKDHVRSRGLG